MRTLDTNVIVRLLVGDDPRQTPIAEQAFLEAIASGGVYLPDVVLAEVAWVLRGYGLERQVRHGLLERLVRTRSVVVDDIDGVILMPLSTSARRVIWPISSSLRAPPAPVPCRY